jgi:hypothetical protein
MEERKKAQKLPSIIALLGQPHGTKIIGGNLIHLSLECIGLKVFKETGQSNASSVYLRR